MLPRSLARFPTVSIAPTCLPFRFSLHTHSFNKTVSKTRPEVASASQGLAPASTCNIGPTFKKAWRTVWSGCHNFSSFPAWWQLTCCVFLTVFLSRPSGMGRGPKRSRAAMYTLEGWSESKGRSDVRQGREQEWQRNPNCVFCWHNWLLQISLPQVSEKAQGRLGQCRELGRWGRAEGRWNMVGRGGEGKPVGRLDWGGWWLPGGGCQDPAFRMNPSPHPRKLGLASGCSSLHH